MSHIAIEVRGKVYRFFGGFLDDSSRGLGLMAKSCGGS